MPRVTEAHRSARRQQILEAARRCFLRDGFHATSMQDVFRESGLSPGAVYRYFPGKAAIVAAIAETAVAELTAAVEQIAASQDGPPLDEALARALAVVDARTGPEGAARIAIQVWGESMRDPALADFTATTYRTIRARFVELARRAQARGELPADADAEQLGAVLFGLMPGYILQRLLLGDVDPAGYLAGLRALLGTQSG